MKVLLISALICVQFSQQLLAARSRVICYWPDWRLKDKGDLHHTPEDIDSALCTHLHLAFHVLDDKNNVIKDKAGGPEPEVYQRLNALKKKNPELKLIASLGGDGEPDAPYSHLISDVVKRKEFIKNTINYLQKYAFDGLDIDWEYPVCWGGDCSKGPKTDKANFGKFVQELRKAFDKQNPRLSLSAAVIAGDHVADLAYDYKVLGANLDYISVMTYANAGAWAHKTTHSSGYSFCVNASEHYVSRGIPKDKVLMGIAFYGHALKLADKNKHSLDAPIAGEGQTPNGVGFRSYYREICDLVKNYGWTKEREDEGHDPIVYHDTTWVGYDDPYQAFEKSKWVRDNGYGGIIIWEISMDDFHKKCCSVDYPMLRAINHGLYGTGSGPESYGCEHK